MHPYIHIYTRRLTKEAPIGFWHMNQSDIVHYFQGGAPLAYHLIRPDGTHERHVLGPDVAAGHTMQVRCHECTHPHVCMNEPTRA